MRRDAVTLLAAGARKDVAFRSMLEALKWARPELNINSLGYTRAREMIDSAIKLGEQALKE